MVMFKFLTIGPAYPMVMIMVMFKFLTIGPAYPDSGHENQAGYESKMKTK
jgi:hypothetical protein